MPATPSNPTNVNVTALFTPVAWTATDPTSNPPLTPVVPVVNVNAVHLVLPMPIRRWNGTSWTYQYRPRF